MTSRQLYEGVLIELHKENAPNVLLEDFNYFANKAVNNYVNKRYNIYDINQQTTDDLRVLKATALLKPEKVNDYAGLTMAGKDKMATYEVIMPSDYLHILNCICIYRVNKTYKCYNAGDTWRSPATRLTADMYSLVLDNFWNKPTYKRPYYYIHNVNTSDVVPTNPVGSSTTTKLKYNGVFISYSGICLYAKNNKLNYYVNDAGEEILTVDSNYQHLLSENTFDISLLSGIPSEFLNEQHFSSSGGKYSFEDQDQISNLLENCITTNNLFETVSYNNTSGTDVSSIKKEVTYKNTPNGADNTSGYRYGTDGANHDIVQGEGLPDTITLNIDGIPSKVSNRERGQGIRYGNVSQVRLEIRYGTDDTVFQLTDVYVDYIKAPQFIRLTQEEIDLTEDTSQMLEYPDYVCQEIINELVHLIMENISDLRLQTHPVVSQSIANPAQALAPAQGLSAQL